MYQKYFVLFEWPSFIFRIYFVPKIAESLICEFRPILLRGEMAKTDTLVQQKVKNRERV